MTGRTLLAGFIIALAVWSSPQSMAFDGEFLSTQKLQEAYRRFCPIHINELKTLLRKKKTKVHGTSKLVVDTYNGRLKCDFQNDPSYKRFEESVEIQETEDWIRRLGGREKYAEATIASLAETREKYRIELLLELAGSNVGLSEVELKTLIAFAKTTANSDSVVLVLRSHAD